ncbi:hypothetical protein NDU88_009172 [Pleurodeles waltl]|uniref:Uncharacterized protein n=1 Tax=Pleurodeles waltl TaxID=8319 RepID=A0AAV7P1J2_PLEWA|nr:hypothetical protein NDU88_009172 [Pleurodeles waltl]
MEARLLALGNVTELRPRPARGLIGAEAWTAGFRQGEGPDHALRALLLTAKLGQLSLHPKRAERAGAAGAARCGIAVGTAARWMANSLLIGHVFIVPACQPPPGPAPCAGGAWGESARRTSRALMFKYCPTLRTCDEAVARPGTMAPPAWSGGIHTYVVGELARDTSAAWVLKWQERCKTKHFSCALCPGCERSGSNILTYWTSEVGAITNKIISVEEEPGLGASIDIQSSNSPDVKTRPVGHVPKSCVMGMLPNGNSHAVEAIIHQAPATDSVSSPALQLTRKKKKAANVGAPKRFFIGLEFVGDLFAGYFSKEGNLIITSFVVCHKRLAKLEAALTKQPKV